MANGVRLSLGFARRVSEAVRQSEADARGPKVGRRRGLEQSQQQRMFGVRVTIDGGSAGSVSTTCSWTYTVELDSGYVLGEELTPQKRRLPNVPYTSTPADSWGAGFFDKNGAFVLWDANELPEVEDPCS